MQLVVDHALVGEDRDLLAVLGIGFLLLALVQVGVTALRSWAVMVLGTTLNLTLVTRLFRQLLRLPISFFERRHLGDIVSRFESLSVIRTHPDDGLPRGRDRWRHGDRHAARDGLVQRQARADRDGRRRLVRPAAARAVSSAAPGLGRADRAAGQAAVELPRDRARRAEREALQPPTATRRGAIRTCWSISSMPACACNGCRCSIAPSTARCSAPRTWR